MNCEKCNSTNLVYTTGKRKDGKGVWHANDCQDCKHRNFLKKWQVEQLSGNSNVPYNSQPDTTTTKSMTTHTNVSNGNKDALITRQVAFKGAIEVVRISQESYPEKSYVTLDQLILDVKQATDRLEKIINKEL